MTIDEYLQESRRLKHNTDRAKENLEAAESRIIAPRSSLNLGDGIPIISKGENRTETRMIEYVSAGQEFTAAATEYEEWRHQLQADIGNIPYWAATLLEQAYIRNVYFDRDLLYDLDEILQTSRRDIILSKLAEAKQLLRQCLLDKGVDIE